MQTNCPNCGAIIKSNKCEYCGTNFEDNSEETINMNYMDVLNGKDSNIKDQVIVDEHNRCKVHVIYNDNDTTVIVMSELTGKKEFVMLPPKCRADTIRGFIDSLIDVVSPKDKEDKND